MKKLIFKAKLFKLKIALEECKAVNVDRLDKGYSIAYDDFSGLMGDVDSLIAEMEAEVNNDN